MATTVERRRENVAGDFYVDESCIDCDACRWMAPETFRRAGEKSAVHRQPADGETRFRALQALVACPTASIGTVEKHAMKEVVASFPRRLDDNVHHCGFHDESSFGAASYLVVRDAGNVMIDVPRYSAPLVRRIEELGGVRTLFLTHRDDVGEHQKYHDRFGCERILHVDDAVNGLDARVERLVEGREPVALDNELTVLPVPGHSLGSCVLLDRGRYLFSGDHLAFSAERGHLYAFRDALWHDWDEQIRSMRRLADYEFEWVLPGHASPCRFDRRRMRAELARCIDWMESVR
jgi:glyoxylase-like metal-dependent hydrolase (beta-lactamase superfamily II)/ferredoxin